MCILYLFIINFFRFIFPVRHGTYTLQKHSVKIANREKTTQHTKCRQTNHKNIYEILKKINNVNNKNMFRFAKNSNEPMQAYMKIH